MKFSKKVKADIASYEMANYEVIAEYMGKRLKTKVIVELCCGIGITAIQLAKFSKVIAVDSNKEYIGYARYNSRLYKVEDKIDFIIGDAVDEELLKKIKATIAVLDPDWSASDDKSLHVAEISETQPTLDKLYNLVKKNITKNIAFRFPKTINIEKIKKIDECEIQKVFLKDKFMFYIAYFGKLIKEKESEVRL